MKKFIIFAVSAIFCVAVAMPAVAGQVKVGGMVGLDIYYLDRDGANVDGFVVVGNAANSNGFEQTAIQLPWAWTRLMVSYTSDDKTLGALIDLRNGVFAGNNARSDWGEAYAWWAINPMIKFKFGRTGSVVSPYNASTFIGSTSAQLHFVGADFGNLFASAAVDQFQTIFTLSDMFSIQLALVDPDTTGADPFAGVATGAGGLGASSSLENEFPRIDVAMPLNFGPVQLVPSFTYLPRDYDEVTPGNQDDIDCWCLSLGGKFSFGPVTFTGEINAGENMDAAITNWNGVAVGRPMTYTASGTSQVADANYIGYWADLAFKFGKVTIHGIVGGQQTDCDGDPTLPAVADANEYDYSRTMYGITVPIAVAPGFSIQPELMFYDFGDDNKRWNPAGRFGAAGDTFDDGEERVFGVEFKLIF